MGFIPRGTPAPGQVFGRRSSIPATSRFFALPAAKLGALIAAAIFVLALVAGVVRILPLVLTPGVSQRAVYPLLRGAIAVSLEVSLFVAAPLGWALAAARFIDRGEARALSALGVRPVRIVATAWPAALWVAVAAGCAAAVWGTEAAAPGRMARALLAEARRECIGLSNRASDETSHHGGPGVAPLAQRGDRAADGPPGDSLELAPVAPTRAGVVDVPLVGVSWICFPNEEPRAVGPAPFAAARFSAKAIEPSDDLRAVELRDLILLVPAPANAQPAPSAPSSEGSPHAVRLEVGHASIKGLSPFGRASNLGVIARTAMMGLSAVAIAALTAWVMLVGSIRGSAAALLVGMSGPAAALAVMSALERGNVAPTAYFAVPAVGLVVAATAGLMTANFRRIVVRIRGTAREHQHSARVAGRRGG